MTVPREADSKHQETTMIESRSKGDPRRPHDRLRELFAEAYEALESMEGEIDSLIEAGEMDGDWAEGTSALEWGARLDELKGMAGGLAMRIDGVVVETQGPPGEVAGGPGYRKDQGGWRERLGRARRSSGR
jgi:hypothetical protein